jgi:hypothetical protein
MAEQAPRVEADADPTERGARVLWRQEHLGPGLGEEQKAAGALAAPERELTG